MIKILKKLLFLVVVVNFIMIDVVKANELVYYYDEYGNMFTTSDYIDDSNINSDGIYIVRDCTDLDVFLDNVNGDITLIVMDEANAFINNFNSFDSSGNIYITTGSYNPEIKSNGILNFSNTSIKDFNLINNYARVNFINGIESDKSLVINGGYIYSESGYLGLSFDDGIFINNGTFEMIYFGYDCAIGCLLYINGGNVSIRSINNIPIICDEIVLSNEVYAFGESDIYNYELFNTEHVYEYTFFESFTKKHIIVYGLDALDKIYDGTNTAAVSYTSIEGIDINDDVDFNIESFFANKNAGKNKKVSINFNITGSDSYKYIVPDEVTMRASIYQRKYEVINPCVEDKNYDGTSNATFKYDSIEGIVDGDDIVFEPVAYFLEETIGNNKEVKVDYYISGKDINNYYGKSSITLFASILEYNDNEEDTKKDIDNNSTMLDEDNSLDNNSTMVDGTHENDNIIDNIIIEDQDIIDNDLNIFKESITNINENISEIPNTYKDLYIINYIVIFFISFTSIYFILKNKYNLSN